MYCPATNSADGDISMRVLIAPDKFKDALDAEAAARAIAAGVLDADPDAEVVLCPMADGGEGTAGILADHYGAQRRLARVHDAVGRECSAAWWHDERTNTAYLEAAQAAGLWRLPSSERNPLRTSSFGVGEMIEAARSGGDAGGRVIIGVGGTATVDGGAGCLQAMGYELLDADGVRMSNPAAGGDLTRVRRIESSAARAVGELIVLTDVSSPLLGDAGAARIFGPQKGASPEVVEQLEAGMSRFAECLRELAGREIHVVAGAGAAGGLAAALVAIGGRIVAGGEFVADIVLPRVGRFDLCFTGEGRLDAQSVLGKVVGVVAQRARALGARTVALVGEIRTRTTESPAAVAGSVGIDELVTITPPGTELQAALRATAANLRRCAWAAVLRWHSPGR